ncbi:FMN-binding negative transcriptional regulator [Bordetella trematum]|uniref:FMN-binding negative transcriptional regulator n=1 Tax=Bordetella trematum TaxID=123899 RepID=UPI003AF3482A
MYLPSHFQVTDTAELHALMRAHPLGVLVTQAGGALDANHLPFELESTAALGVLHGHVARANPVWQELADGDEVLVAFRAEAGYISPGWFPSKHETHEQVPSWNYRVVHARGRVRIHDDERYVRGLVARLTRRHEAGKALPWKMTDSAPAYIDRMLSAIVGLSIEITALEGKFKLSQNKARRDIEAAATALAGEGDNPALGAAMRAALPG